MVGPSLDSLKRHRTMENAHICQPSVPLADGSDVVFFGGHGGHGGELLASKPRYVADLDFSSTDGA